VAAFAAGLMDWMDVDPPEKAVGVTHGILNTSATILFAISLLIRWQSQWRPTLGSFLVALAGYFVVSGGAYLGGGMVFRMGVMINRNAYRKGPDNFLPAFAVAALQEGQPQRVEVGGQPILLLRSGERIYAIGAVCSHYGAPLEEGKVLGGAIQCPWHFSRFGLADGSVCEGPACAGVPAYEVRVVNGQVEIKLWR
jgi:nitrite reductase/ring-hydroxylating ferredoxin subunit